MGEPQIEIEKMKLELERWQLELNFKMQKWRDEFALKIRELDQKRDVIDFHVTIPKEVASKIIDVIQNALPTSQTAMAHALKFKVNPSNVKSPCNMKKDDVE